MAQTMPPDTDKHREARIEPIRVTYNGIRYRSALEADWAATFTQLGIYFQYEPQPWQLPSGASYDCDFYLPTMGVYCEAKGPHNERLWKPQEFAAALERDEFPDAFKVLVLRPAGPNGGMTWENAGTGPNLRFAFCNGCQLNGFAWYDDTWALWFCRRCHSTSLGIVYQADNEGSVGPFHALSHAPRPGATA